MVGVVFSGDVSWVNGTGQIEKEIGQEDGDGDGELGEETEAVPHGREIEVFSADHESEEEYLEGG